MAARLDLLRPRLAREGAALTQGIAGVVARCGQALDVQARQLEALSHTRVLERGYVIVQSQATGHVVPRLAALGTESELELVFADGELPVRRADARGRAPEPPRRRRAGQPAVSGPERGIDRLLAVMRRLRDPERGCPWDIEQSFATIAPYTIEEAYEVADAIAREDWAALPGELGDLLLAGGLLHADGRRAGPLRLRRRGRRHRRQDDRAPPARVRRRGGGGQRRADRDLGGAQGRGAGGQGRGRRRHQPPGRRAAGLPGPDPGAQAAETRGARRLRLGRGPPDPGQAARGDRRARGGAGRGRPGGRAGARAGRPPVHGGQPRPPSGRSTPRPRSAPPTPSSSAASAASRRRRQARGGPWPSSPWPSSRHCGSRRSWPNGWRPANAEGRYPPSPPRVRRRRA